MVENNKHIKVITRDRASAYARHTRRTAGCKMQVADRFHLHGKFALEAIKGLKSPLQL